MLLGPADAHRVRFERRRWRRWRSSKDVQVTSSGLPHRAPPGATPNIRMGKQDPRKRRRPHPGKGGGPTRPRKGGAKGDVDPKPEPPSGSHALCAWRRAGTRAEIVRRRPAIGTRMANLDAYRERIHRSRRRGNSSIKSKAFPPIDNDALLLHPAPCVEGDTLQDERTILLGMVCPSALSSSSRGSRCSQVEQTGLNKILSTSNPHE